MQNPIDKILKKKNKVREQMDKLRLFYIVSIYRAIYKKVDFAKIHKDLLDETLNYKKPNIDPSPMLYIAQRLYLEARQLQDGASLLFLLFDLLDNGYHLFSKPIQKIVSNVERVEKQDYINKLIDDARSEKNIFYLCSKHLDCAEDHLDWQGRLYVDQSWDSYTTDQNVLEFVNNNRIPTIQWVTDAPIFMTTRPNCRHFFKPINNYDVLTKDTDTLLGENDMSFRTGYDSPKYNARKSKLEMYKSLYKISKDTKILKKIKIYSQNI